MLRRLVTAETRRFLRPAVIACLLCAAATHTLHAQQPDAPKDTTPAESADKVLANDRPVSDAWKRFSELPIWEDGLSEMSYYDATCVLYDKKRSYTRVHLMNRQFMSTIHYIKAMEDTPDPAPALKFVISEEIPTENYNYRFLTTAFLERPSLRPIKVSVTSQEWCGHTFKQLTWERRKEFAADKWSLDISCYSYFPDEGDRWFPHAGEAYIDAHECLFLFARAVVAAGGESHRMSLLKTLRSNHLPDPNPLDATLRADGNPRRVTVPMGSFDAQRVVLDWDGDETWFDVETAAPHRLLAFKAGDVEAKLKGVERRAYWDRSRPSKFYKTNQAP